MSGVVDLLVRPQRVALIGVSRDPDHLTARPARYLSDWGAGIETVIVHPSATGSLHGHPVVPTIHAAGHVDVALLLVPADGVVTAVEQCASAGVDVVISVASGFTGEEGRTRHDRLRNIVTNSDIRLLGPNCVGLVSPASDTVLSFSSVLLQERPAAGHVGLVTQSGAIGNALMLALSRRGAGLAHWISTGDEVDIGAIEIAAGLADDPDCRAVGLFIEGVTDPEWLPKLAATAQRTGTRLVALRGAASAAGRRAALGHTGRVVGDDDIARAALRDAGIHLVESLHELTDTLTVLSALPPAPPDEDPLRVAVVTVSGGSGVLAADAVADAANLAMADLNDAARTLAQEVDLPLQGGNPLDVAVLGRPEVFPRAIEVATRSPDVDAVLAIVSTLAHDYDLLASAPYDPRTPLVLTHLSPEERFTPDQASRLADRGVASVPSATSGVRALAVWAGPRRHAPPVRDAAESSTPTLPLSEAVRRLSIQDVSPPVEVVNSVDAALDFLADHGVIALKADGVAIAHRTDVGAIATGLETDTEVRAAWDRVSDSCRQHGDRVVAQAMARPGIPMMLTATHDQEVGPAVIVRPGGVHTELMVGTVVLTGDPDRWSHASLGDGAVQRLLDGWRGQPPCDVDALLGLARRLRTAVATCGTVECNPVLVHPAGNGLTIVDVLATSDVGSG